MHYQTVHFGSRIIGGKKSYWCEHKNTTNYKSARNAAFSNLNSGHSGFVIVKIDPESCLSYNIMDGGDLDHFGLFTEMNEYGDVMVRESSLS